LTDALKNGKPIKMLFVFSDGNDVKFMETFFYNPKKKKGGIFYIPANVGSRIETLDKVDQISVLYKQGDVMPLKKKVEQLLDTDISFYIDFQISKLVKAVDLLEGIEVFISNPVSTDFEGRKVLLPSGNNILDGDKAKDYILYSESNEEDRDVVWRKQKFLQSFLKRLGEPEISGLFGKNIALDYLFGYMNTNISKRDLKTFIDEIPQFDTEHIYPGKIEGKITIVEDKELLFPLSKGDYVKISVKQMLDSIMSEEVFDDKVLTISLEILNGTETNGLASRARAIYQSYGYDVLSIGNAETTDNEYTVAIDRKGNTEAAKKIADLIKCDKVRTETKTGVEYTPDVTLILGKDFNGSVCKK
jgi:anionic cell wall polymer biosynthesis LytR-Cps2A-Psr (LCP) family protein